jgi:hypothetical protein
MASALRVTRKLALHLLRDVATRTIPEGKCDETSSLQLALSPQRVRSSSSRVR